MEGTILHEFTGNEVCYFNPEEVQLEVVSFSHPIIDPEEENEHAEVRNPVKVVELPYFSLEGQDIGKFEMFLRNRPNKRSVNIPEWMIARPVKVKTDKNGSPIKVVKRDGKVRSFLKDGLLPF